MDVALTTNGVLFDDMIARRTLPDLSWIKFSIDAGTSRTYSKLHGTKKEDFNLVLTNMSRASFLNRLKKYGSTIGIQAILFKENIEELPELAKYLKYAKSDYFVVKPYSEHIKQLKKELSSPTDEQIENFLNEMKKYKNDFLFFRSLDSESRGNADTYGLRINTGNAVKGFF